MKKLNLMTLGWPLRGDRAIKENDQNFEDAFHVLSLKKFINTYLFLQFMQEIKPDKKEVFLLSSIGAFIASLCCFTPLILFLVGLSTASFSSSLADVFYGQYKWFFRLAGFLFLMIAFVVYLRTKGICTINQAKRQRNKIINFALIVLITSVLLYFIWLYVIVEYAGVFFNLW